MELNLQVIGCKLETLKSNKTGRDYTKLSVEFENGYTLTVFPKPEEIFILKNIK